VLTCLVHKEGKFTNQVDLADISELIKVPENLVWLDVLDPTDADMDLLAEEFGFHVLSLEDAMHPQLRPKIDEYEGYFFLAAHALKYDREKTEIDIQEVDLFVGKNYVVTVHKDPIDALKSSIERCEKHPHMLKEGVGFLVYSIMDAVIDDYMPVLDQIDEQVDQIEESIFADFQQTAIADIFKLKREMLQIRRTAGHLRDVFNILCRRDQPLFTPQTLLYFQDIYDHLFRITDAVDIYRDVLTGALEAYLSLNANKLNAIMKVFAGLSIILMTSALIAGIYGMNFKHMPELEWPNGYYGALALMVGLGIIEFIFFRRRGWL